MAVEMTKEFWAYDDETPQWKTIQKIVFTSPHMDSPPAAGTRSHVLPGSDYIGTWFEAGDLMHRVMDDQNIDNTRALGVTSGAWKTKSPFVEFTLVSGTYTFGTASGIADITFMTEDVNESKLSDLVAHYENSTPFGSGRLFYNKTNYLDISYWTLRSTGEITSTTTISGVLYDVYDPVFVDASTGTATISGILGTADGDRVYFVKDNNTTEWAAGSYAGPTYDDSVICYPKASVLFEITDGEAYNCRLTAWDDVTHSTTANQVLDGNHYMAICAAYRGVTGTKELPIFNDGISQVSAPHPNWYIHQPESSIILKGNVSYYGDFDLVHVPTEYTEHGEYLIFFPYLVEMDDSFTPGNYDFVTTLHYQYT